MGLLNFNNNSYVLYQILPDHKKIAFLNDSFDTDVMKLSQKYYEQHFAEIIHQQGDTEIGILSYLDPDGFKINIFFHDDYIHVNSERLKPIRDLVSVIFQDGNILVRDKSKKKTKHNKERFHMRFYRAYKKLNDIDGFLPIVMS